MFASKKEAHRYDELLLAKERGLVVTFLMQVPFKLPGGVRYVIDYIVFWEDGTTTFEDIKGVRTESYKAKKRMVEDLYHPITITER